MDLQNQLKTGAKSQNPPVPGDKSPKPSVDDTPRQGRGTFPPLEDNSSPSPGKGTKEKKININFKTVLNWVIFLLVILSLGYVGYDVYKALIYQPTSKVNEIKIIEDQSVIRRIDGSVEQGKTVSPSESGYGRGDPFAKY